MLAEERRQRILELLAQSGVVTVKDLSERFRVVPITVRRDLEILEKKRCLTRIRGGAVASGEPFLSRPLTDKETLNREAKVRIAAAAAELIRDGETLILDEGSTCIELARSLHRHRGLTVVTNGIKVAMELIPVTTVTTVVIGGVCGHHNYVAFGHDTVESFRQVRAHKYFMGIDALQPGHGISDADPHQVPLKQAKAASSERVIGIADKSKLGKIGVARVGPLGMMDVLVMDGPVPQSFRDLLADEGVDLVEV